MPRYDFLCACEKEFSKILALSKYAKGGIVCPHCKSKNEKRQARKRVSQARYSARAFLSGMSRAWFQPLSTASSVVAGSVRHISAIRTGTPAWRRNNDEYAAKAGEEGDS